MPGRWLRGVCAVACRSERRKWTAGAGLLVYLTCASPFDRRGGRSAGVRGLWLGHGLRLAERLAQVLERRPEFGDVYREVVEWAGGVSEQLAYGADRAGVGVLGVLEQCGDLEQLESHSGGAVAEHRAAGVEGARTLGRIGRSAQRARQRAAGAWSGETRPRALLKPTGHSPSISGRGSRRRRGKLARGLRSGRHFRSSAAFGRLDQPWGRWPWPLTNRLRSADRRV